MEKALCTAMYKNNSDLIAKIKIDKYKKALCNCKVRVYKSTNLSYPSPLVVI